MRKQISTSLEAELIRELKLYCAENDVANNQVIENALCLWLAFARDKSWREVIDFLPSGTKGGHIREFIGRVFGE